jgi:hypothetical protein
MRNNMEGSPKCTKAISVLNLISAKSLQINDATVQERTIESDKNCQSSNKTFDSIHNERVVRHISQNKYKIYEENILPDVQAAPLNQNEIQQRLKTESLQNPINYNLPHQINNINGSESIEASEKWHRQKAFHKCITPNMNANIMNNTLLYLLQISKMHSATTKKIKNYFYHQSTKLVTNYIGKKVYSSYSK